jgi:hypothetical protein
MVSDASRATQVCQSIFLFWLRGGGAPRARQDGHSRDNPSGNLLL